jgi:hypothetical protein
MERSRKSPTHVLWRIRTDQNGKARWQSVGSAWVNSDGSINIRARDMIPEDARLQLRVRTTAAARAETTADGDKAEARDLARTWGENN